MGEGGVTTLIIPLLSISLRGCCLLSHICDCAGLLVTYWNADYFLYRPLFNLDYKIARCRDGAVVTWVEVSFSPYKAIFYFPRASLYASGKYFDTGRTSGLVGFSEAVSGSFDCG